MMKIQNNTTLIFIKHLNNMISMNSISIVSKLTEQQVMKLQEIGFNSRDCLRKFLREEFDIEFTTEVWRDNSTLLNGIFTRFKEVVSDNLWLPEDEAHGAETPEDAFLMSMDGIIDYCVDLYNESNVMEMRYIKYLTY